jgi:hypothetical protein
MDVLSCSLQDEPNDPIVLVQKKLLYEVVPESSIIRTNGPPCKRVVDSSWTLRGLSVSESSPAPSTADEAAHKVLDPPPRDEKYFVACKQTYRTLLQLRKKFIDRLLKYATLYKKYTVGAATSTLVSAMVQAEVKKQLQQQQKNNTASKAKAFGTKAKKTSKKPAGKPTKTARQASGAPKY